MQLISWAGRAHTRCLQCQTGLVFLTSPIPIKCALHQDLKNTVQLYILLAATAYCLCRKYNMRPPYSKDCLRSRGSLLTLLIRSGELQTTKLLALLIFNGNSFKCVFLCFHRNYQSFSREPWNALPVLMGWHLPFSAVFVIWLVQLTSRMSATKREVKTFGFFSFT